MTENGSTTSTTKGGIVLAVLASAMFVYVIDTTIMNVSISALVEDLDTTISGVQGAITLYTLTMAAFMLTGGKLGDIWGSKRAFRIGLVVYGIGTVTTAFASSLGMLLIGWSVLEGLGSALIVPAINVLVRANFVGAKRASAYGVLFGVAAAGAAFGPLVGGWLTTNLSWRVAFGVEALIVLAVLAASPRLIDAPPVLPKPKLDLIGVLLSASGLGLVVFGVLQSSSRGVSDPVVIGCIVVGFGLLIGFWMWVRSREAAGKPALMHPSIFRHASISAGLPILSTQTFAQAGLLFLIPVFTQSILGFDAFQTGLTLLPLSIGVLATSILTPPLGRKIYPRYIIQGGLVLLFVGGFILARDLATAQTGLDLGLGLLIGGLAIGLIAGQLPNLILSGVEQSEASEASGLQGTAQNLGMAMGTAVIGLVIISVALTSMDNQVQASDVVPPDVKEEMAELIQKPFEEADRAELRAAIADLDPDQQAELDEIYDSGTLRGFQGAVMVGGLVALFGALLSFRLPLIKLEGGNTTEENIERAVRNPSIAKLQFEMSDLSETAPDEPEPTTD